MSGSTSTADALAQQSQAPASPPVTYFFGPFRISTHDRLLRREDEVLSLPPKVIDTLLVLVENAGELVTKEALIETVWGSQYLDANNLPQNISRLRKALGEDFPESPIVNIPKRGYRFAASVRVESSPVSGPKSATKPNTTLPNSVEVGNSHPNALSPAVLPAFPFLLMQWVRRGWLAALCVAILVAGGISSWIVWRGHHQIVAAQPRRPSIAILGFDDLSGDAKEQNKWIAIALEETLYSEISADQGVRLVPNAVVWQARRDLDFAPGNPLPPPLLAALRQNLGCDLVVRGHYLRSNGNLRVDIMLEDDRTGESVGAFSHTDSVDHLLPLITASGQDLRARLGMPSLTPVQASSVTASLMTQPEALRNYAEGVLHLHQLDAAAAKPYFEQAIALEPQYSLAHMGLSTAWSMLGYDGKAAEEARKAFDLSGGLSHEEQLEVQARYDMVIASWPAAVAADHALFQAYPDNIQYGLDLAAALRSAGKPQEAFAVVAELRKLSLPVGNDPRIALSESLTYQAIGDFPHAQSAAATAVAGANERHASFVKAEALVAEGDAIDRQGDHAEARKKFESARSLAASNGNTASVVRILRLDAQALRLMGDLTEAKAMLNQAIDLAQGIGDRKNKMAAISALTQVYRMEGDLPTQKRLSLEVLEIARDVGDRASQAGALLDLGNELNNMGDPEAGRKAYLQCFDIAHEIGDSKLEGRSLGNLGILEYTHGQLAIGQKSLEQAIGISRKMDDKTSVAYRLGHYASVLEYEGKLIEAKAALDEKCALNANTGEKIDIANCKTASAELSSERGDSQPAIQQLEWITQNYTTMNPAMDAWRNLAITKLQVGDVAGAKDAVDHATEFSKHTVNEADFLIPLAIVRGKVQAKMGDTASAEKSLKWALSRSQALGLAPKELETRWALAEIHRVRDRRAGERELSNVESESAKLGFVLFAQEIDAELSRK